MEKENNFPVFEGEKLTDLNSQDYLTIGQESFVVIKDILKLEEKEDSEVLTQEINESYFGDLLARDLLEKKYGRGKEDLWIPRQRPKDIFTHFFSDKFSGEIYRSCRENLSLETINSIADNLFSSYCKKKSEINRATWLIIEDEKKLLSKNISCVNLTDKSIKISSNCLQKYNFPPSFGGMMDALAKMSMYKNGEKDLLKIFFNYSADDLLKTFRDLSQEKSFWELSPFFLDSATGEEKEELKSVVKDSFKKNINMGEKAWTPVWTWFNQEFSSQASFLSVVKDKNLLPKVQEILRKF